YATRPRASIAGDACECRPQVAGIGNEAPQLAKYVVEVLLTARVQLALLAPEPAQIGPRRHIRGFLRRLRGRTTHCPPPPCTRLSRARTTTGTLPLARDIAGLGSLPTSRRRRSSRGSHVPRR